MASQYLFGIVDNASNGNSAAGWNCLMGYQGTTGTGTLAATQTPIPAPGNFKALYVYLKTNPGTGKSRQFQLDLNGTPSGTLTVTISDAATSGSVTATVAVAAGDLVAMKCTPSGTPSTSVAYWMLEFDPTTADDYIYMGIFGTGANLANLTYYTPAMFTTGSGLATSDAFGTTRAVSSLAGTIKAIYCNLTADPLSGRSRTFNILINGVQDNSATTTLTHVTTGHTTGLSIAVAVGDYLTVKETDSGTAASARASFGIVLHPTTSGMFLAPAQQSGNPSNASTSFLPPMASPTPSTTEANVQTTIPVQMYAYGMAAVVATAPSSGKSWTYKTRIGGSNGTVTFAITDAATSGNDTSHNDSITAAAVFDISLAPSGTPTNQGGQAWTVTLSTVSPSIELDVTMSGGISFSGAATIQNTTTNTSTMSGGMAFSGAATIANIMTRSVTGSGGMTFSGAATVQALLSKDVTGSGGIHFGGTGAMTFTRGNKGGGNNKLQFFMTMSGGMHFGGAASIANTIVPQVGGGMTFGGVAQVAFLSPPPLVYQMTMQGGIAFSGSADVAGQFTHEITGSGGMQFGGAAEIVYDEVPRANPSSRAGGAPRSADIGSTVRSAPPQRVMPAPSRGPRRA